MSPLISARDRYPPLVAKLVSNDMDPSDSTRKRPRSGVSSRRVDVGDVVLNGEQHHHRVLVHRGSTSRASTIISSVVVMPERPKSNPLHAPATGPEHAQLVQPALRDCHECRIQLHLERLDEAVADHGHAKAPAGLPARSFPVAPPLAR